MYMCTCKHVYLKPTFVRIALLTPRAHVILTYSTYTVNHTFKCKLTHAKSDWAHTLNVWLGLPVFPSIIPCALLLLHTRIVWPGWA